MDRTEQTQHGALEEPQAVQAEQAEPAPVQPMVSAGAVAANGTADDGAATPAKIIAHIVDTASNTPVVAGDVFHTANGLSFKLRKVSRLAVVEVGRKYPMPKIPVLMDEDKGREIENEMDPTYIQARQDAQINLSMGVSAVYISLGTQLLTADDKLPQGIFPVDAPQWSDTLEELGIDISPVGKRSRYVQWVKFHALDSDEEFAQLVQAVMRNSGQIAAADVEGAERSFRPDEAQPTAT